MATRPTKPLGAEDMQARLDRLRESANESARTFRTAYTFYLVVALYILVIVSSTDHELLFRAGDVQMPIVNVGVPVVWFFVVVPWLLVLLHFNLLMQATFLADKVRQYAIVVIEQTRAPKKRTEALGLLYPAPLAHKVAEIHQRGSMRRLLNAMVLVTLAVLPPAVLIFAQVKFLPYQGETFTWLHRAAIGVDIGLLWWLWPRVAEPQLAWRQWFKTRWIKASAVVGATALTGLFVVVVADFPGGTIDRLTPSVEPLRDSLGRKYDLSNRTLVLKEPSPEVLAAHYRATCNPESGCDESAIAVGSAFWCEQAKPLQLSHRSFRNANLSKSTLCSANLEEAALQATNLFDTKLRRANLRNAKLHEADLSGAILHRADVRDAELCEAPMYLVELYRAVLRNAELHKANLRWAILHHADMR
ncbi:MAG: pentapeptide repeat-containing protein, partial [Rhodospirillaceae bacterium]|nr:pentapeptide repeat-containing protein [Rhodospirillaceae bacterium]